MHTRGWRRRGFQFLDSSHRSDYYKESEEGRRVHSAVGEDTVVLQSPCGTIMTVNILVGTPMVNNTARMKMHHGQHS
jgi:hypothetical protein